MTLEELWQLFPISLVPYKEEWKENFQEEMIILSDILKDVHLIRIEHIGSTAVKGIYAKDIVDILIEVSEACFDQAIKILNENHYIKMNQQDTRATFNKGYTDQGYADKVFHIHLRRDQDIDELYFRDYLIDYPLVAKSYETLKLSLWEKYTFNRDGYTEAKTDFIKEVTQKAKDLYKDRYEKK